MIIILLLNIIPCTREFGFVLADEIFDAEFDSGKENESTEVRVVYVTPV